MDYSGKVYVNVEKKSIEATLSILVSRDTSFEALYFYLPRKTEITSIYADGLIYYETSIKRKWSPFIVGDKEVCLRFSEDRERRETTIRIAYKTIIDRLEPGGMNLVTPTYMEVGLHAPWFPVNDTMEPSTFDLELLGNSIYFIGGYVKQSGNRWRMRATIPSPGYPLIAAKCFSALVHRIDMEESSVRIFWTPQVDEKHIDVFIQYIESVLELYQTTFGTHESVDMDILMTHRKNTDHGGAYCRPGLIVIPCGENQRTVIKDQRDMQEYFFKYLANELAHLWWSKVSTLDWNSWMNKSFDDYSALQAIEAFLNREYRDRIMAE